MGIVRQTYVISDLHLGGNYAANDEPGFRLCTQVPRLTAFVDALRRKDTATELVINGDLVDFLAEGEGSPPKWTPFLSDPDHASRRLERIIARDRNFFEALARFLERGHRVVLVLVRHLRLIVEGKRDRLPIRLLERDLLVARVNRADDATHLASRRPGAAAEDATEDAA